MSQKARGVENRGRDARSSLTHSIFILKYRGPDFFCSGTIVGLAGLRNGATIRLAAQ